MLSNDTVLKVEQKQQQNVNRKDLRQIMARRICASGRANPKLEMKSQLKIWIVRLMMHLIK